MASHAVNAYIGRFFNVSCGGRSARLARLWPLPLRFTPTEKPDQYPLPRRILFACSAVRPACITGGLSSRGLVTHSIRPQLACMLRLSTSLTNVMPVPHKYRRHLQHLRAADCATREPWASFSTSSARWRSSTPTSSQVPWPRASDRAAGTVDIVAALACP